MKIALVQFDPQLYDNKKNMEKAQSLMSSVQADVYILPEMAFSGYMFQDTKDITPYVEDQKGETFKWASRMAIEKQAFVQVGYPEKGSDGFYNSILIVDRQGQLIRNYQKHHLYETDYSWATPGPSYGYVDTEFGRIGLGICMDLNPYRHEAPFELFEWANYQLSNQCEIFWCSMAWLKDEDPPLQYWAVRMTPLIQASQTNGKTYYLCIANRTGTERGTVFCGCSCIMKISQGRIVLEDVLEEEEEVLVHKIVLK